MGENHNMGKIIGTRVTVKLFAWSVNAVQTVSVGHVVAVRIKRSKRCFKLVGNPTSWEIGIPSLRSLWDTVLSTAVTCVQTLETHPSSAGTRVHLLLRCELGVLWARRVMWGRGGGEGVLFVCGCVCWQS